MRVIDIGIDVRDGQKFTLGPNNKGLIRVLTVTSITSLGVTFSVTPGTWSSNKTEMYANFNDKGFWDSLKSYKEKVVHRAEVLFYRDPWGRMHHVSKEVGVGLEDQNNTLYHRTTVEYTEEK